MACRIQRAGQASSIGALTHMHIGIMGTMAQMTLSDLRDKTKRGQLGRARAGRVPGGLAYGYAVVPPAPGSPDAGERKIISAEAAIVGRIFKSYAAGTCPRTIARDLNAADIPGPDGRPWIDTTIRGEPNDLGPRRGSRCRTQAPMPSTKPTDATSCSAGC